MSITSFSFPIQNLFFVVLILHLLLQSCSLEILCDVVCLCMCWSRLWILFCSFLDATVTQVNDEWICVLYQFSLSWILIKNPRQLMITMMKMMIIILIKINSLLKIEIWLTYILQVHWGNGSEIDRCYLYNQSFLCYAAVFVCCVYTFHGFLK